MMIGRVFFSIFIISYFIRFTSRYPILGSIRFELLLGGLILLCILLTPNNHEGQEPASIIKRLKHFTFYIFLSLPLVTWPGSVLRLHLEEWVKVALFFTFLIILIRTTNQLKWIFGIFLACQTIRIIEPLYMHLTVGYWGSIAYSNTGGSLTGLLRLSGAPHDIINPNQLAWLIVSMLPFFFYLLWNGVWYSKIIVILLVPLFIYCLLLTGSRSGLISLIVVIMTMVYFSKKKLRNFIITILVAFSSTTFFSLILGSDLSTRYLSIIDNTVAGADTAQGRINGIIQGISSISHNPLFGNGIGTSLETNFNIVGGSAQITHNLYLEIFQEVGLIGFILFMLFISAIIKTLFETKCMLLAQGYNENNWLFRLTTAIQTWIIMHLIYSLSCYGLRSWEWYFFGGITTVCLNIVRQRLMFNNVFEKVTTVKKMPLRFSSFGRNA